MEEETIVDRIRLLCWTQKPKTSITKLEESLGFANGTIGKWPKAKRGIPLDKVILVAKALGTTPDYLLGTEITLTPEGERQISDRDIKFALWGDPDMDDEDLADVRRYADFIQERKKDKK